MYNIGMYLYQLGIIVASLFNEKVRRMWRGEREAIRTLRQAVDPTAKYVWFHAASLGEFEQGRPLMEQLRREHPEYKILLTFFSPSGYEVRKNYEGADIICYLPIDTVSNARRFLRTIRPVMAFFIKYEFWYNYLHILRHRKVPVYSVSSIFRKDQIFFKWYGRQYGRVLNCFTHFYVQNDVSRQLLSSIGIQCATVVGDTRFDRVLQIKEQARQLPVVEKFLGEREERKEERGERKEERGMSEGRTAAATDDRTPTRPKVFIAGSSWQPDEEIFIPWFKEHRDWKLIIAPHVIGEDHLQQIERLLEGAGLSHARYTRLEADRQGTPLWQQQESAVAPTRHEEGQASALIIDCFGLLSSVYHYADVTYVGGGFGVGIHNTLEAAVWGVPVIFGPNNARFQEAQGLKASGAGKEIRDSHDFDRVMQQFLAEPALLAQAGRQAEAYVRQMTGATQKILSDVNL